MAAARRGGNRQRELDRAIAEGEAIAVASGGRRPPLRQSRAVRPVGWPVATRGRASASALRREYPTLKSWLRY
uniref:Uncharacterized protein n=1 Tax=Oryza sativa subsp. japonica TaxID=39947 RepID=Q6K895_ORYSJ|nr:hypothetical protein [Oryza sativa Japonica Group]